MTTVDIILVHKTSSLFGDDRHFLFTRIKEKSRRGGYCHPKLHNGALIQMANDYKTYHKFPTTTEKSY